MSKAIKILIYFGSFTYFAVLYLRANIFLDWIGYNRMEDDTYNSCIFGRRQCTEHQQSTFDNDSQVGCSRLYCFSPNRLDYFGGVKAFQNIANPIVN